MKISEVSKRTGLSPSAIRYYINYGLILPRHTDYQYHFSEADVTDILLIQTYKRLSFSLDEILQLLVLRRLSHMSDTKDIQQFNRLLSTRVNQLRKRQEEITASIGEIEGMYLSQDVDKIPLPLVSGVPLSALSLLRCPHCQGKLAIRDASIWEDALLSATLHCHCGYEATVKNGILITDSVLDVQEQFFYQPGRSLLEDYDANRLKDYVEYERQMRQHLCQQDLHNKVLLETNIRKWFFLLKNMEFLDDTATYIVSSPYVEVLETYKKQLELHCPHRKILFLAGQPSQLPLSRGSVDYWLDYFDTGEHFELSPQFLPQEIARYLSSSGAVFGVSACIQSDKSCPQDTQRCDGSIALPYASFTQAHFTHMMVQQGYHILDWIDFPSLYRYALRDTASTSAPSPLYGTFRFFYYQASHHGVRTADDPPSLP